MVHHNATPLPCPNTCTHPPHLAYTPQELILFSRADLERSIPSMVDGLKPGQRKILFCCFKRNLVKDVKVGSGICVQGWIGWWMREPAPGGDLACSTAARPQCSGLSQLLGCTKQARLLILPLFPPTAHVHMPACTRDLSPTHGLVTHTPNSASPLQVAQLSGYVSEHSAYHHGEASLQSTIVGLAQDFVGSNNINLLFPSGQFGTRLMGGKDAASPR